MPRRYAIAFAVAGALIGCGFAIGIYLRHGVLAEIRQTFREQEAAGTLPAELRNVDIDSVDFTDFGLEVSEGTMFKAAIAEWLLVGWMIWVPVVVVACLGIAAILSRFKKA